MKFKLSKNLQLLVTVLSILTTGNSAYAMTGESFNFNSYFRSGVGANNRGGQQECFKNSGASVNEFRLGNECGTYGEIEFDFKNIVPKNIDTDKYVQSHFRFDFNPEGKSTVDTTNVYQVREMYIQFGNIGELKNKFWIGKRYGRDSDIHMNDFRYFADINGNGAGVKDIKTKYGKWDISIWRETPSGTSTSNAGTHATTFFDFRLSGVNLSETQSLDLWTGYSTSPGGRGNGVVYDAANGQVLGARLNSKFGELNNKFAVIFGNKQMQSLGLGGDASPVSGVSNQKKANRLRVVETFDFKPTANLDLQFATMYETADNGAATNNKFTWMNIGARPVYLFSENYSLATEVGHSKIKNESDRLGNRTLTRFTIAPQMNVDMGGLYSRPVLRFYYTHSMWNTANKSKIASNAPTYGGKTSGSALGFQGEVWF